jgi:hypothetical protein
LSNLAPNATLRSTMTFLVNSLPSTTTTVINQVDLVGVRREGNTRPVSCSTFINLGANLPPTLTPTPTDEHDGGETPAPTKTASPGPTTTPGAGTPGTGTPGVGTPGPGTPGPGTPGPGTPDAGTPGPGTPGAGTPGAGAPGPGTPGAASTIFPVNILPETGSRAASPGRERETWLTGLICLGVAGLLYLRWQSQRKKQ